MYSGACSAGTTTNRTPCRTGLLPQVTTEAKLAHASRPMVRFFASMNFTRNRNALIRTEMLVASKPSAFFSEDMFASMESNTSERNPTASKKLMPDYSIHPKMSTRNTSTQDVMNGKQRFDRPFRKFPCLGNRKKRDTLAECLSMLGLDVADRIPIIRSVSRRWLGNSGSYKLRDARSESPSQPTLDHTLTASQADWMYLGI